MLLANTVRGFGIVLLCIGAAMVYGVCHDLVTARVCIEYFSEFHSRDVLPPGMNALDPTLQGLFWGVYATWWMGFFIGVPLAIVARVGSAPPLSARDLVRPVAVLLGVMAGCAVVAFALGHVAGTTIILPSHITVRPKRFMAVLFAHNASYLAGGLGGVVLVTRTAFVRYRKPAANKSNAT